MAPNLHIVRIVLLLGKSRGVEVSVSEVVHGEHGHMYVCTALNMHARTAMPRGNERVRFRPNCSLAHWSRLLCALTFSLCCSINYCVYHYIVV